VSSTSETALAVRPFQVAVPKDDLATSAGALPRPWPEKETVADQSQSDVDKGGHFALREQPDIFTNELRAAFRSLR
jgi:pimeloyl-ACP methyl ester carboxylesterase